MAKGNDFINVLDLENTCWRGRPPKGMYNEIVEIGIACVDYRTHEVKKKHSIIIKPKSEISEFFTSLTGIDQELVDKEGVSFKKACDILIEDFSSKNRIWMSWGDCDKIQFKIDCKFKKVQFPFGRNYFDVQKWFEWKKHLSQSPSVSTALEMLDMEFEGVPHRADVDAYNVGRMVKFL